MQVRRADAIDISALFAMLKEMHSNTELDVAPIDDYKLLSKINEVVHKGCSDRDWETEPIYL